MAITRLAQHQYAYPYLHLKYPGAGHLIAIPYQPTTTNTGGVAAFKMAFGGNARSQAAAAQDAWTQILGFLAQYLPSCGARSRPQSP
jgi:dienelactone hydrolase